MALSVLSALFLLASFSSAQTDSYAPTLVTCPSTLLRTSGVQNPEEAAYVTSHKQAVASTWQQFFSAPNHNTGYDLSQLFPNSSAVPTLGLACSGGGYRAALACAGSMTAFDINNSSTTVGGVLQMASYLAGLSGGSWAVGSYAINGFPDWTNMVLGDTSAGLNGWQLQYDLVVPGGIDLAEDAEFLDHISNQVEDKKNAGFNVSITDAWGRALSYHFAPYTTGNNFYDQDETTNNHAAKCAVPIIFAIRYFIPYSVTWTDLTQSSKWTSYAVPVPLIVADSLPPNTTMQTVTLQDDYAPITSVVYEFSPWEFGSHDAQLAAFLNITYLGTSLTNGQPANASACVNGFENFGFVIGTSASLFNAILAGANNTLQGDDATAIADAFNALGENERVMSDDIANYPNPFEGISASTYQSTNETLLQLVDGGENGENVPLRPLLVPSRDVDVIIALDNSADTDAYWPNATSLFATQSAGQLLNWNVTVPPLPANQEAIVASGFNTRPVFFGCNASTESNVSWPLLVYLPNAPTPSSSYQTNQSTFKLGESPPFSGGLNLLNIDTEYSTDDASSFLDASHFNAAQTGTDLANSWPTCLSCALVERARVRAGLALTSACSTCFEDYCYGGANLPTNNGTAS